MCFELLTMCCVCALRYLHHSLTESSQQLYDGSKALRLFHKCGKGGTKH